MQTSFKNAHFFFACSQSFIILSFVTAFGGRVLGTGGDRQAYNAYDFPLKLMIMAIMDLLSQEMNLYIVAMYRSFYST